MNGTLDAGRSAADEPRDRLGRSLLDLRLSVTDRCNFRCRYCRPVGAAPPAPLLARSELLSFEEIERLAAVFVRLGVRKIRLTGGEPLLRRGLPDLVARLARFPVDLAMTTNGAGLAALATPLARAGLRRVSVSLDALGDATFRAISGTTLSARQVLDGIEAAERAGLAPVKINVVVQRGVNEQQAIEIARRFRGTGRIVRFIEYMEVLGGQAAGRVVPAAELLVRLWADGELVPVQAASRGEVAARYAWADGSGEIGLIAPVSRPFCGDCTRARLSADGHLYNCLFAERGRDLRTPLRAGASDAALAESVLETWSTREDRHCKLRAAGLARRAPARMGFLGG